MHEKSKAIIVCPVCGMLAYKEDDIHYVCACGWDSLVNTVDIFYKDPLSGPLSNLFPHKFVINDPFYLDSPIHCQSIESFIQSLRVKDSKLQRQVCENYSGYMAWKLRLSLGDWRPGGMVYWQGNPIQRISEDYEDLLTMAYDALFDGNDVFREIVLPAFKDKILIHSIGCESQSETLLTELEYRAQLQRLMNKLK